MSIKQYFIQLSKYNLEVDIIKNVRVIKYSSLKEMLNLKDEDLEKSEDFVNADLLIDFLFEKIYVSQNATKEQDIIYKGLCLVGLYPLIDEACGIDLRRVSYIKEFNNLIKEK